MLVPSQWSVGKVAFYVLHPMKHRVATSAIGSAADSYNKHGTAVSVLSVISVPKCSSLLRDKQGTYGRQVAAATSLSAHSEIGSSFADSDAHLPWKQRTPGHPEVSFQQCSAVLHQPYWLACMVTLESSWELVGNKWSTLKSGQRRPVVFFLIKVHVSVVYFIPSTTGLYF